MEGVEGRSAGAGRAQLLGPPRLAAAQPPLNPGSHFPVELAPISPLTVTSNGCLLEYHGLV